MIKTMWHTNWIIFLQIQGFNITTSLFLFDYLFIFEPKCVDCSVVRLVALPERLGWLGSFHDVISRTPLGIFISPPISYLSYFIWIFNGRHGFALIAIGFHGRIKYLSITDPIGSWLPICLLSNSPQFDLCGVPFVWLGLFCFWILTWSNERKEKERTEKFHQISPFVSWPSYHFLCLLENQVSAGQEERGRLFYIFSIIIFYYHFPFIHPPIDFFPPEIIMILFHHFCFVLLGLVVVVLKILLKDFIWLELFPLLSWSFYFHCPKPLEAVWIALKLPGFWFSHCCCCCCLAWFLQVWLPWNCSLVCNFVRFELTRKLLWNRSESHSNGDALNGRKKPKKTNGYR